MKIVAICVFSSLCVFVQAATNQGAGANANADYNSLLAGIVAACAAITSFNRAKVQLAYTCKNEVVPERIEPLIEVAGKEKIGPAGIKSDTAFLSDANPNTQNLLQQSCTSDSSDILYKCIQPIADKLKRGQITYADVQKMQHEGFHIRGYHKNVENARSWEFHHENRAKQDIGVTVMDGYYFGRGKTSASELMFFPRKQVQQYTKKDGAIEVTLANGELLRFNSATGKIDSGVLTETKMVRGKTPLFAYKGAGVMIQMSGMEGDGLSHTETAKNAVITKKGFKPCVVPASELWPQRKTGKANNFRFATDEGLDKWLKQSNCGFSL